MPRLYIPWDLDTTMHDTDPVFGAPSLYTSVLFTHWEDDYDTLLTGLLAGPLTIEAIHGELDRAQRVAGTALDADPSFAGESIAGEIETMKTWWSSRHTQISGEFANHAP
jgi:hypothetical protein